MMNARHRWLVPNGGADHFRGAPQRWRAACAGDRLVTAVKRDIRLLDRVDARAGDSVSVGDVALGGNRESFAALRAAGVRLASPDHHFAENILTSPMRAEHVKTVAETSGGMIFSADLGGLFRPWAVAGAHGDDLRRAVHAGAGGPVHGHTGAARTRGPGEP